MASKYCFLHKLRPCDATCKAAFPVDDATEPVDCYFIWLAANAGEALFDVRRLLEASLGGSGQPPAKGEGESEPSPGGPSHN